MKTSMSPTLAATLIATAVGIGAWFFGIAKIVWPEHPQVAALLITVVTSIVVRVVWPGPEGQRANQS